MASIQAFLFGDQTLNVNHGLRRLLRINTSPSLISFFEQALHALRYEFSKLSASQRPPSFRFSTIEDLLTLQHDERLPAVFEPVLTCLYELGLFIRYYDQKGKYYPQASNTLLTGLCTGALSAAAVSCSTCVPELVEAAVQTVLVAFRAGVCVTDMADRLQPGGSSTTQSWSVLVIDVDASAASVALEEYSASRGLPAISRPYISSVAPKGVTVSGRPEVLEEVGLMKPFKDARTVKLHIRGPFHAAHLFSQDAIQAILGPVSDAPCMAWTAEHAVISSYDGTPFEGQTLRDRLVEALEDILQMPIQYGDLTEAIYDMIQSRTPTSFSLCSINTNAGDGICAALGRSCKELPHRVEIYQHIIDEAPGLGEPPLGRFDRSKIAIIGLSGRYPSGDNNEEFWDLLRQGLDVHKETPPLHWDVKTHVDLEGKRKNTSATPYGCWLENPGLWDARFFNISPREAPQIDPAQRLALLTAYEAIEQAGIVPGATPSTEKDRVGVFYGVTSNDWMETNSAQAIDTYFIPGGNRAFIPGRVNYFFKFSGPSYAIDTACSSSLAAIHIACNSLWRGDVDTAIAGGTNILTNPDFTAGLDRGHFLSRTGNCKTFDDGADGYCRGEAVGTVILKRLEDAVADKDPIQGVILGAYTNHSAEAESITRPHPEAQKEIFRRILNQAGVDAKDVDYVECHGTGTQAGDAGEMESILSVFAPKPGRKKPLYLGSAKANIGHGEGASGISSLAKVLLMMQKDMIPPHCGIKTRINHRFPTDLPQRNVHIAREITSWRRATPREVRRVFVNNFSAAGGNSALVLEDAPAFSKPNTALEVRTAHPVAVSAKSASSLAANLKSLLAFLENSVEEEQDFLAHLSYTTTARRIHHAHRVMVNGANTVEIKNQLQRAIIEEQGKNRPKSVPKLVFAFTGQGSQYPGMGKELFESFSVFRSEIIRLEQLARNLGFPEFKNMFTAAGGDVADYSPVVVQLAAVCMQIALAKLWASWGLKPTGGVVGHSLGEYAALNVAGVLSDADTLYLVGKRAELLVGKCTAGSHAMLAVLSTLENITTHLRVGGHNFEIACLNAPKEVVLSGSAADMAKAAEILNGHGIKATLLRVPYAFHSSQVEPVLEEFEALAAGVTFRKPVVAVMSPLLAANITEMNVIGPDYLRRHCRETVNLEGALSAARNSKSINDDTIFVEFGPHPVVSGLVKATLGQQIRTVSSMRRNKGTWHPLTSALASLYIAGIDIQWAEYHRDFPSSHRVLQLPAYNWDLKNYWMQYVNDWSLRKGDPLPVMPAHYWPTLSTTTVHKLVEETGNGDELTIVVESDISRPDLNPLVQGHKVNGIPLCTPSVYADIALTVGNYVVQKYRPSSSEQLVDIGKLTVEKALIAKPKGPQILQTTVKVDLKAGTGHVVFASVNDKGRKTTDHASSGMKFTDRSELVRLQAQMEHVKQRVLELQKDLESGRSYRFNSKMAYLMVLGVAQFHEDYRCIDEVILNSGNLEAVGWIDLAKAKKGGSFTVHPAYVDAMTQLGGFVMNANDGADLDKEVFVNHGWKSAQIYQELQPDKKYRNYVKMVPKEGNMFEGDVVIFDEDNVVASFKGVELQGVPRRVLHYILSAESAGKDVRGAAAAKPTAKAKAPVVKQIEVQAATATASSGSSCWPSAIKIIEEESGIDAKDLTNDTAWSDIGVDSLLSLVISSRFKEELSIDIDSSDFLTLPTVGELKAFLTKTETAASQPPSSASAPIGEVVAVPQLPPTQPTLTSSSSTDFDALMAIISEESGVAVEDLTDDTNFADIGIDSLLTLVITSRCSEELGLDLDGQSRIFIEQPNVGDLRRYLLVSDVAAIPVKVSGGTSAGTSTPDSSSASPFTPAEPNTDPFALATPMSEYAEPTTAPKSLFVSNKPGSHRATSVVLQGKSTTARRTLIFFPDGSGSAHSYAQLPRIADDVCVIGLSCPFLREPAAMRSLDFDDVMDLYLAEVRSRQPHGPYYLGGWSSGGIFAFRAAQRLAQEGETVASLVLIDSPVPRGMDRLPPRFYEHLKKHDVFGRQAPQSFQKETAGKGSPAGPPEWLVPHFNATIDLLETYYADPLPGGQVPKTSIIWAGESVFDGVNIPKLEPRSDDTEGMKFLSEKRTDFSPGAWADLFPGVDVHVDTLHEAHHFSMMRGKHAETLVQYIRNAIA